MKDETSSNPSPETAVPPVVRVGPAAKFVPHGVHHDTLFADDPEGAAFQVSLSL